MCEYVGRVRVSVFPPEEEDVYSFVYHPPVRLAPLGATCPCVTATKTWRS